VGEQDLAAGGGVQRGELADPVVRGDGAGAAYLEEVDRELFLHDRDVDGLLDLLGEAFAHRAALLRNVDTAGDRAGQPYDPEAEPVLPALAGLLHQAARLQSAQ
jgi:hypothetical protein